MLIRWVDVTARSGVLRTGHLQQYGAQLGHHFPMLSAELDKAVNFDLCGYVRVIVMFGHGHGRGRADGVLSFGGNEKYCPLQTCQHRQKEVQQYVGGGSQELLTSTMELTAAQRTIAMMKAAMKGQLPVGGVAPVLVGNGLLNVTAVG